MVDSELAGALDLTSATSEVSGLATADTLSVSVLSPAVMRSVSVTDFLSYPADHVKRGFPASDKHSGKVPSAPNRRLCNGGRQDRRRSPRRIGVVLASTQYGCRCRCCNCWTAPRIARFLIGSKQTPPVRLWIDHAMLPPVPNELRRRPPSS